MKRKGRAIILESMRSGASRQNIHEEALLEQARQILLKLVDAHKPKTFEQQEQALARALRQIGRSTTQTLLEDFVGPQPAVVLIDGRVHKKVLEDACAHVATPFGRVAIQRALYRPRNQRGQKGEKTCGLLEQRAGLIDKATPRLAEILTYYHAQVPSHESLRMMDLAGLCGPRRAALQRKASKIGHQIAEQLDELLEQATIEEPVPKNAAMITIGMDRVTVPYEEANPDGEKSERTKKLRRKRPYQRKPPEPVVRAFHADFVGSVTFRDRDGELIGRRCYALSHTEDPRRLAAWLVDDVVRALGQHPKLLVSLCQDGARELWPLLFQEIAHRAGLRRKKIFACVDFHHFIPRVKAVIDAVWRPAFFEDWQRRILNEPGAVEELYEELLLVFRHRRGNLSTPQMQALHEFQTYIEERIDAEGCSDRRCELFDYATLRKKGLPIGSGPVEACAKSVVSVRMKRCGDRWSIEGARATMTCRAIALSDDRWDRIWSEFAQMYRSEIIPLRDQRRAA